MIYKIHNKFVKDKGGFGIEDAPFQILAAVVILVVTASIGMHLWNNFNCGNQCQEAVETSLEIHRYSKLLASGGGGGSQKIMRCHLPQGFTINFSGGDIVLDGTKNKCSCITTKTLNVEGVHITGPELEHGYHELTLEFKIVSGRSTILVKSGSWGVPGGTPGCAPQTEVCDGKDNDCDGLVDEGCQCVNGQTRECYTGPAGTKGVGMCKAGIQTCSAGKWSGSCAGQVTPYGVEYCNGKDDNCDGIVDEFAYKTGEICGEGKWCCYLEGSTCKKYCKMCLECINGQLVCTKCHSFA